MTQSKAPKPAPPIAGMLTSGAAVCHPRDDENVRETALARLNHLFRMVDAQYPDDPLRSLVTSYRQSLAGPDR